MAASHTVTQFSAIPQISRFGVLTLYGYGIRITMQAGHLQIEDGIGPERRQLRLPRVGHRLKRLVCIGEEGFVTLSALRWLTEVGASFVMLDGIGKVRVVTGPTSASETRLRRAQALAIADGTALRISRELISAKLTGQATVVRDKLNNSAVATSITALQDRLAFAENIDSVRVIEARAAAAYWSIWRDVPVAFPCKDVSRVPNHWLTFGPRHSPLTGGPRLSVNPANSLLNYTNAVAESECRLSAVACGLDPGIGFLHSDTANRDSLALDLIETIRPAIEAWLLDWLIREPLRRSDFVETPNGNCRISADFCSKLSETAPTWGKLVAPWAEYVVRELWATTRTRGVSQSSPPTRLTRQGKREVKGATFSIPVGPAPMKRNTCRGCGVPTQQGEHCPKCGREVSREKLIELAKIGRVVRLRPESRKKLGQKQRRHRAAQEAWRLIGNPAWLTEEVYKSQIQPRLSLITISKIATTLGMSQGYAAHIRAGRHLPHARHWQVLAQLAGVTP